MYRGTPRIKPGLRRGQKDLLGYRLGVFGHLLKDCDEEAPCVRVVRQNAHAPLQRKLVRLSIREHALGQLVRSIL